MSSDKCLHSGTNSQLRSSLQGRGKKGGEGEREGDREEREKEKDSGRQEKGAL